MRISLDQLLCLVTAILLLMNVVEPNEGNKHPKRRSVLFRRAVDGTRGRKYYDLREDETYDNYGFAGGQYKPDEEELGFADIRKNVPGEPGANYPAYTSLPPSEFSCEGRARGYYADEDAGCQIFHVCHDVVVSSFLCPVGLIFNQKLLICDWWNKVNCSATRNFANVDRNIDDDDDDDDEMIRKAYAVMRLPLGNEFSYDAAEGARENELTSSFDGNSRLKENLDGSSQNHEREHADEHSNRLTTSIRNDRRDGVSFVRDERTRVSFADSPIIHIRRISDDENRGNGRRSQSADISDNRFQNLYEQRGRTNVHREDFQPSYAPTVPTVTTTTRRLYSPTIPTTYRPSAMVYYGNVDQNVDSSNHLYSRSSSSSSKATAPATTSPAAAGNSNLGTTGRKRDEEGASGAVTSAEGPVVETLTMSDDDALVPSLVTISEDSATTNVVPTSFPRNVNGRESVEADDSQFQLTVGNGVLLAPLYPNESDDLPVPHANSQVLDRVCSSPHVAAADSSIASKRATNDPRTRESNFPSGSNANESYARDYSIEETASSEVKQPFATPASVRSDDDRSIESNFATSTPRDVVESSKSSVSTLQTPGLSGSDPSNGSKKIEGSVVGGGNNDNNLRRRVSLTDSRMSGDEGVDSKKDLISKLIKGVVKSEATDNLGSFEIVRSESAPAAVASHGEGVSPSFELAKGTKPNDEFAAASPAAPVGLDPFESNVGRRLESNRNAFEYSVTSSNSNVASPTKVESIINSDRFPRPFAPNDAQSIKLGTRLQNSGTNVNPPNRDSNGPMQPERATESVVGIGFKSNGKEPEEEDVAEPLRSTFGTASPPTRADILERLTQSLGRPLYNADRLQQQQPYLGLPNERRTVDLDTALAADSRRYSNAISDKKEKGVTTSAVETEFVPALAFSFDTDEGREEYVEAVLRGLLTNERASDRSIDR